MVTLAEPELLFAALELLDALEEELELGLLDDLVAGFLVALVEALGEALLLAAVEAAGLDSDSESPAGMLGEVTGVVAVAPPPFRPLAVKPPAVAEFMPIT